MPDTPKIPKMAERVGEAVREAFLRQRIVPWGGMDFIGVNPPVDWAAIGQAAIAAGARDSERKLRHLIEAVEQAVLNLEHYPHVVRADLRTAIEEAKR